MAGEIDLEQGDRRSMRLLDDSTRGTEINGNSRAALFASLAPDIVRGPRLRSARSRSDFRADGDSGGDRVDCSDDIERARATRCNAILRRRLYRTPIVDSLIISNNAPRALVVVANKALRKLIWPKTETASARY